MLLFLYYDQKIIKKKTDRDSEFNTIRKKQSILAIPNLVEDLQKK
jgi:hypothetical protein